MHDIVACLARGGGAVRVTKRELLPAGCCSAGGTVVLRSSCSRALAPAP